MPSNPPTVSVVVPCFQQAQFLPEALGSLLRQTFGDWECIVVDDGSTDDTSTVADACAAQDPRARIRVLRQTNQGLPQARNAGIRNSRGRYILPLDADDMLEPRFLEATVDVLNREPGVAIAYTWIRSFGTLEGVTNNGMFELEPMLQKNRIAYASLFRRAVWDAVGGYNPNMNAFEDWNFWIGALARGFRGQQVPEPLLLYRRRSHSMLTEAEKRRERLTARIALNHPGLFHPLLEAQAPSLLGLPQPDLTQTPHARAVARIKAPAPSRPLVSVIVPTVNRPQLLERALLSVIEQDMADFEVIVVNDAGPPVPASVEALFETGRVHHTRNARTRGLSGARNVGLALARGKYIAYLDDDDRFFPNHLSTLVQALEGGPHHVAYSDAFRVEVTQQGLTQRREIWHSDPFDANALQERNLAPVLCFMHTREVTQEVGGFDESLGVYEDWDLWRRAAALGPFVHVPRVTCEFTWRVGNEGMSHERKPLWGAIERVIQNRYRQTLSPSQMADNLLRRHRAALCGQRLSWAELPLLEHALMQLANAVPSDPEPPSNLALLAYLGGHTNEARARWQTLLREHPQHQPTRFRLALAELAQGNASAAQALLAPLLQQNPNDMMLEVIAADIAWAQGDAAQAGEAYARAVRTHRQQLPISRLHNWQLAHLPAVAV